MDRTVFVYFNLPDEVLTREQISELLAVFLSDTCFYDGGHTVTVSDDGVNFQHRFSLFYPELPSETYEQVEHPPHYNKRMVECIDVIEEMPANLAMATKYVWRAGEKPGVDPNTDLDKAVWYIRRELKRIRRRGRVEVTWRRLRGWWRDFRMAGADAYNHPAGIPFQVVTVGFPDQQATAIMYLWFAAFSRGDDADYFLDMALVYIEEARKLFEPNDQEAYWED